jgi:hypothetical protein
MMQLRTARLCLDCEELHEQQECPVCASESFAFVTRWLPAGERRGPNRPLRRPATEDQPSPNVKTWLTRGLAGIMVMAIGRMFLKPMDSANKSQTDAGNDVKP